MGNDLAAVSDKGTVRLTALPQTVVAQDPAWSPDGATLAFTLTTLGRSDRAPDKVIALSEVVCGMDRTTGRSRTLARTSVTDALVREPTWNADGTLAVTLKQPGKPSKVASPAGDDPDVRELPSPTESARAHSPDGKRVVELRSGILAITDTPGGKRTPVTGGGRPLNNVAAYYWSPDGRRLLVALHDKGQHAHTGAEGDSHGAHTHDATETHSLWVVAADGTSSRRVADDASTRHAAWSRDGGSIVFSEDKNALVALTLSTRARRRVGVVTGLNGVSWR